MLRTEDDAPAPSERSESRRVVRRVVFKNAGRWVEGVAISVVAAILIAFVGFAWRSATEDGPPVVPTSPGLLVQRSVDRPTTVYTSGRDGSGQAAVPKDGSWADSGPDWSPEGDWLALSSDRGGEDAIWRMKPDGSQAEQVSVNPSFDTHPSWAPDEMSIAFQRWDGTLWQVFILDLASKTERQLTMLGGEFPSFGSNGQIVFQTNRDGQYEVYSIDPSSSVETRLTNDLANDRVPSWSPDSTTVAFDSDRSGTRQIYQIDLASLAVSQLVESSSADRDVAWSHDSTLIAFVSDRFDGTGDVVTMNLETGAIQRVSSLSGTTGRPSWSASSQRVAFSLWQEAAYDIGLIEWTPDAPPDQDVAEPKDMLPGDASNYSPSWNEDRTEFAFVSVRTGVGEIWLADVDAETARRVTLDSSTEESTPDLSPDGQQIVYARRDPGGWSDLWIVDVDTHEERQLTFTGGFDPSWSAEDSIAYEATPLDGVTRLGIVDVADGTEQLVDTGRVSNILDPSWSPDASRVVFSGEENGNRDIYVLTIDDGSIDPVTSSAASESQPKFSPDGTGILYLSEDSSNAVLRYRTLDQSGMDRELQGAELVGTFDW